MAKKGGHARGALYTEEVAEEVCARLATGEALRSICSDDHLPAASTICLWASQDKNGFAERYTRALEIRGWMWAEEIVAIADGDGGKTDAKRDRLRVDTRKWLLSKLMPNRFSDKIVNEHTGKDGAPVEMVFRWADEQKS